MSSFADITFMYVLEAIIKPSIENTGRRDTFKIFQQFTLKKLACTKVWVSSAMKSMGLSLVQLNMYLLFYINLMSFQVQLLKAKVRWSMLKFEMSTERPFWIQLWIISNSDHVLYCNRYWKGHRQTIDEAQSKSERETQGMALEVNCSFRNWRHLPSSSSQADCKERGYIATVCT